MAATILRVETSPKFSRFRYAHLEGDLSDLLLRKMLGGEDWKAVRAWIQEQGIPYVKSSHGRLDAALAELFGETVCAIAGQALAAEDRRRVSYWHFLPMRLRRRPFQGGTG